LTKLLNLIKKAQSLYVNTDNWHLCVKPAGSRSWADSFHQPRTSQAMILNIPKSPASANFDIVLLWLLSLSTCGLRPYCRVACCCHLEGFRMCFHTRACCTSSVHHSYHPSADAERCLGENFPSGYNRHRCHRSG